MITFTANEEGATGKDVWSVIEIGVKGKVQQVQPISKCVDFYHIDSILETSVAEISVTPSWHLACQADTDWWSGQELSTVLLNQSLEKGLSRLKDFQARSQTVQTLIYTSCLSITPQTSKPPQKNKDFQSLPTSL